MTDVEFKAWPKIYRDSPFNVTITEKINGTNSCIIIDEGKIVGVQSRKRFITPEDDNYGFAGWVQRNNDELETLGDGYHYGEWAGLGIQSNELNLPEKQLFLFNTFRWNAENPNLPSCCKVVPILFQGLILPDTISDMLQEMDKATDVIHEGVIVYYHAMRSYSKHTIKLPKGKWAWQEG